MTPEYSDCENCPSYVTRRRFLLVGLAAATAVGCQGMGPSSQTAHAPRTIDAGPASAYAADGVYPAFRDVGFFIVRRDGKLEAISSICTHRQCKLEAEPDHTFYCECHGSEFDANGKVTEGPAEKDLPIYSVSTGPNGHLFVSVT